MGNKMVAAMKGWDARAVAMTLSLLVAVLMLVGKVFAYWLTHSAAILSDAAESVVHGAATAIAAFSLWYSRRPPDRQHPYGHGKITYFSAGFEGALIFVAAIVICWAAIHDMINGSELHQIGVGLLIIGVLALVNLGLGLFLLGVGRHYENLILIANGKHVLTDMWTSVGVLCAVLAVWITGIDLIDPIIALIVAANVVVQAVLLLMQSLDGLMERVPARETDQLMAELQETVGDATIRSFHRLRHRRVGERMWVEVHLVFPGSLPLQQAHHQATRLERRIADLFPRRQVIVTTHLESAERCSADDSGDELQNPAAGSSAKLP